MKKNRKIGLIAFIAVIALTMSALSLTGCNNSVESTPPPVKTLTGIKVTTFPTKTEYAISDSLNLAGLVVTATYSDGTKKTVTDYTTNGFDSTTVGDKTITVTHEGKTATFTVTVNPAGKTLTGIAVTTQPTKTVYTVGETLDLTDLVVTATYSDSTTQAVTGYNTSGFNSSTAGVQTITVTYNGKTATFTITVTVGGNSTSAIALTENKWADGNIAASSDEQWFKFTATAKLQYIHFEPGTLTDVNVQVYESDGTTAVGSSAFLSSYNAYTSLAVTSGSVYYIKVTPDTNSGGAYKITFAASGIPPAMTITLPTTGVTTLTLNTWANGNIAASSGEQWFKFTATAATQYIHFELGTLDEINIQLYDSTGTTVGNRINLYDSRPSIPRAITSGSTYYIKVTPKPNGSGAYKISFNASSTAPATVTSLPTAGITALTLNTWANGNIPTPSGEQWFSFTATANPQYIHFDTSGTMKQVNIQVFDNTGIAIGSKVALFSGTRFTDQTVTNNVVYYIRVTPFDTNNDSGTYKIGITASSTAPTS